MVKLKDVTTKIGSGATPRGGKESYQTEGISLIRSQNVYDLKFEMENLAHINDRQAEELNNVTIEKGDILLNITGASVARCCTVPDNVLPARVNQHVMIIRTKPDRADSKFISYSLVSYKYKQKLLSIAQGGSTREALTKEKIEEFEIKLPPPLIQQRITSILSAYDDLIENNTRRIKILEEMAKLIYRKWFVEFKAPGVKLRKATAEEKKVTGKEQFPEGWEVKSLFELSDVIYGFAFNSKLFSNIPNGKPLIRIRNLKSHNSDTFTPETPAEKYLVKNGDLLVGMDGDFHFVKWAGGEAYQNQRIVKFRPKNNISKYYLYHSLVKSIKYFDETVVGTTVAHLSDEDLRTINIILPSKYVLDKINEVLSPLFDLEINLISKNQNLRRTRDLLLPKLVSGEIEV